MGPYWSVCMCPGPSCIWGIFLLRFTVWMHTWQGLIRLLLTAININGNITLYTLSKIKESKNDLRKQDSRRQYWHKWSWKGQSTLCLGHISKTTVPCLIGIIRLEKSYGWRAWSKEPIFYTTYKSFYASSFIRAISFLRYFTGYDFLQYLFYYLTLLKNWFFFFNELISVVIKCK